MEERGKQFASDARHYILWRSKEVRRERKILGISHKKRRGKQGRVSGVVRQKRGTPAQVRDKGSSRRGLNLSQRGEKEGDRQGGIERRGGKKGVCVLSQKIGYGGKSRRGGGTEDIPRKKGLERFWQPTENRERRGGSKQKWGRDDRKKKDGGRKAKS